MNLKDEAARREELVALTRKSEWLMEMLVAARGLSLSSWCIGAGAVRNLVWDAIHEIAVPSELPDVDLAYYDASCLDPRRDNALQSRLKQQLPGVPWEVTNQAAVHHWFEAYFGYAVPPLESLEDAVASWPEYATAVGVRLEDDDSISIVAPHGLEDLFACVVRRNPARVSEETYRHRVRRKSYAARWPQVQIVHC